MENNANLPAAKCYRLSMLAHHEFGWQHKSRWESLTWAVLLRLASNAPPSATNPSTKEATIASAANASAVSG